MYTVYLYIHMYVCMYNICMGRLCEFASELNTYPANPPKSTLWRMIRTLIRPQIGLRCYSWMILNGFVQ